MSKGGARSNQFECEITLPGFISGAANISRNIKFLAHSASIPASTVSDTEVWYRGRAIHFAGERTFQPWTISVYNDNDFTIRNAFEKWVNEVSHAKDTNGLMNPATYQTDMYVRQKDRSDLTVATYKFVDAWPLEVGAIGLSWDENNRIQSYDLTFVHNYFEQIPN
jgi:hypothetical protein